MIEDQDQSPPISAQNYWEYFMQFFQWHLTSSLIIPFLEFSKQSKLISHQKDKKKIDARLETEEHICNWWMLHKRSCYEQSTSRKRSTEWTIPSTQMPNAVKPNVDAKCSSHTIWGPSHMLSGAYLTCHGCLVFIIYNMCIKHSLDDS